MNTPKTIEDARQVIALASYLAPVLDEVDRLKVALTRAQLELRHARGQDGAKVKPGWAMPVPPVKGATPHASLWRLGGPVLSWRTDDPAASDNTAPISWPFVETAADAHDFRLLGFAVIESMPLEES